MENNTNIYFQHIVLAGVYPQFVIVKSDHPAKSMQELLATVKAKPGTVNYASAGVGTSGFLAAELLKQTLGLNMTHIPYKGPAQAITDLLGGRLDMVLTASGGSIGPFRYVVLYNDTQTSPAKPLICYWDYGSSISVATSQTFTLDMDPVAGFATVG